MFTNIGLVQHVKKALYEKWGYVRGTYGLVLTESILQAKIKQCGDDVTRYIDYIRSNYLKKPTRTADCVNLIKSYLWWDESKNNPVYSSKYDVNADGMFNMAKEKGTINSIPEIIGLCVWHKGHIGVYIGNGQVIESHGTKSGVIQTPLKGKGSSPWTHWLKCPFIDYTVDDKEIDDMSIKYGDKNDNVKLIQGYLNDLGFNCGIPDGIYGKATLTGVNLFKGKYKLEQDGNIDIFVLLALIKEYQSKFNSLSIKLNNVKDIVNY